MDIVRVDETHNGKPGGHERGSGTVFKDEIMLTSDD
jgi:hypothetical protein